MLSWNDARDEEKRFLRKNEQKQAGTLPGNKLLKSWPLFLRCLDGGVRFGGGEGEGEEIKNS